MEPLTKKETVIDHVATGAAMRRKRKAFSISARRVADLLRITPQYLSDLEAGRRNWTPERVTAYNNAINRIKR